MSHLLRALSAEALKLRRTLALWLTAAAPLLLVLVQFVAELRGPGSGTASLSWDAHLSTALEVWAFAALPLLIAVEAALIARLEHRHGAWSHLFALPLPHWAHHAAKQLVVLVATAAATAVLCAGLLLSGVALAVVGGEPALASAPPLRWLATTAASVLAASGLLLALQTWLALRTPGLLAPLGIGIVGTATALMAGGEAWLGIYPWAMPGLAFAGNGAVILLGAVGGTLVAAAGLLELGRREQPA